jgi:uncharacterized protein (TIGR03437 family)
LRALSINSGGVAVFTGTNSDFSSAIYTGSGGPPFAVAPLPLADRSEVADINDAGTVAFTKLTDIVETSGSSLRIVDPNKIHSSPGMGQLNRQGTLVFYSEASDMLLLTDNNGVLKTVASGLDAVGVTHTRPAINDTGVVAVATLVPSGAAFKSVVSRIEGGQTTIVATSASSNFGAVNVNNSGTVAFTQIQGGGGTITGIYTGPDSVTDKVIAVGDSLFGGKLAALQGTGAQPGRFLNDAGQICFSYVLDNGSKGVAVATPVTDAVPAIKTGGVVPVYSSSTSIQPGSWVSIYGSNLARATTQWSGDFPVSLGGTSVTINSKPAFLWFVSPTQINLQVPDDLTTGPVQAVVTTAAGKASATVTLAAVSPSFSLLDSRHVTGIILRSDGSGAYGGGTYDIIGPTGSALGYRTVAARAGDIVELFGVGFGPTNPAIPAGHLFSGVAQTTNTVNLLIGSTNIAPVFSGLSSAGLCQINLVIPQGLGSGDFPLSATVGGALTQGGVVISLQ